MENLENELEYPDNSIINCNELLLNSEPSPLSSSTSINGSQQSVKEGSGKFATIFLIVNTALGAGLLNFPQAYDQAGGIATAQIVQAILVLWILGALFILTKCAENTGATTLQEILLELTGKAGYITCSILIILCCFGACVTFLVIIGDQFDRVLSTVYGVEFCHHWYMNRHFTVIISSICLILPLAFSRRIDFLKYASSVGVFAVLYVVALIMYEKYAGGFIPGPVKTKPDHWTDVLFVIPDICFSYQCHVSVVPIYACLRNRSMKNFASSAVSGITICVLCYSIAGIFGYLSFGSNVPGDILLGFGGENPLVLMGIAAITMKTFTTYPILLFCGREAVSSLLVFLPCMRDIDVAATDMKRRVLIASIWFILSLLLALLTPNIQIWIDLVGSLAAVFIFISPGICLLQTTLLRDPAFLSHKSKIFIFISCVYIFLGTFIVGVVLAQIPDQMAKESTKTIICASK